MTKEQYHSDFEMGSDTDESDDNSIDHEDFYRPKNREPIDNTEVKLTLMQKARRRPDLGSPNDAHNFEISC
ncbi:unnamed protein product [Schistosoma curassoni]|uniref:Uncharacterized protein n=1 Tax=Schistosoma curassoni TaxID=6186 RepID=A0A183K796_9TREM|nr:unnamed protein product [Schistosoma curassoni]